MIKISLSHVERVKYRYAKTTTDKNYTKIESVFALGIVHFDDAESIVEGDLNPRVAVDTHGHDGSFGQAVDPG
jgi:hypothetical protein